MKLKDAIKTCLVRGYVYRKSVKKKYFKNVFYDEDDKPEWYNTLSDEDKKAEDWMDADSCCDEKFHYPA